MIRICYVCQQKFGEKEPYEDRSLTHGVCPECWPGELARVEKSVSEYKLEKGDSDDQERQSENEKRDCRNRFQQNQL
jgi:hypothetical protein